MDAVWIILDSLSYRTTSFGNPELDLTPNLKRLVRQNGVLFEAAYAPGPLSMSSHASIFTGELPSIAGMHRVDPFFETDAETIADTLDGTHETHLITTNPWLLTGLDRGFDTVTHFFNDLIFEDAADPYKFIQKTDDVSYLDYLRYILREGKPIRSAINGIAYKFKNSYNLFGPTSRTAGDPIDYQYADSLNEEVIMSLSGNEDDFTIVNYMDVHPPFDISDQALDRFFPGKLKTELLVGVNHEQTVPIGERSYDVDDMIALYRASVWDLDRKLSALLESLISDGVFVAITADHGSVFQNSRLAEGRLHVPLLIFAPNESARTVPHSVNISSLKSTTETFLDVESSGHTSLLDVNEDQISVTEVIDSPDIPASQVVPSSYDSIRELTRDVVLLKGSTKVIAEDGEVKIISGTQEEAAPLIEMFNNLPELRQYDQSNDTLSGSARNQLEDLGYL